MSRPLSPRFQTLVDAKEAISFLMDNGAYWSGTKKQFAFALDWRMPNGKDADVRKVQDVCTLTRDQGELPEWMQEELAGYIIAYAPSQGGMVLIDPASSDMPLHHYVHILYGDLARQQQHKTENRRRLPTWEAAAKIAFQSGDQDLARLCAQAEDQINRTGFVIDSTVQEFFKVVTSRGLANA